MEETGCVFFKRKLNVHRVCDVIIIVSTQPEDDFRWIKQKQRLQYFLYWAGIIFYTHLLVCNGCVLQYFIIGHPMMIGADLYSVYLGRKQWLVEWIKIPKDVDV